MAIGDPHHPKWIVEYRGSTRDDWIMVGSFKNKRDATAEARSLRAQGWKARIRREQFNPAAVRALIRSMNPGKKLPAAVRVKRLKGGGISVTPIKMNAGPRSIRKSKKRMKREFGISGRLEDRIGKPMFARKKARASQRRGRFDPRYF